MECVSRSLGMNACGKEKSKSQGCRVDIKADGCMGSEVIGRIVVAKQIGLGKLFPKGMRPHGEYPQTTRTANWQFPGVNLLLLCSNT